VASDAPGVRQHAEAAPVLGAHEADTLTIQEAAERVRLTQWALYRAVQRGELTAYKPGGRLRIREADLEAWLQSTRVRTKARPATRSAPAAPPGVLGAARPRGTADSVRARVRASRGKRRAA
jgi:excisionase family DNA binding protein